MIIGVDFGGTKIRAGINSGGIITDQQYILLHSKESLDSTLTQLKTFIARLIKPEITGIGIGAGYMSIIGPIKIGLMYGNYSKEKYFNKIKGYISIGFNF